MFKFLRKRTPEELAAPKAPTTLQRWTATLPPRLRAKLERLHPAEQADRRQLAEKWPEREYVDYLWSTFDFLAGTATWRDVQEYTIRESAYPPCHGSLYDAMPDLKQGAEEHLTKQNAMITTFRQSIRQLATDHPAVRQQLVSLVYHLGQGRFADDDGIYQDFRETLPELAQLVDQIRTEDAAAHTTFYESRARRRHAEQDQESW